MCRLSGVCCAQTKRRSTDRDKGADCVRTSELTRLIMNRFAPCFKTPLQTTPPMRAGAIVTPALEAKGREQGMIHPRLCTEALAGTGGFPSLAPPYPWPHLFISHDIVKAIIRCGLRTASKLHTFQTPYPSNPNPSYPLTTSSTYIKSKG